MATRAKKQATTIAFAREKETKNTVKFSEVPEKGSPPVINTLYVQKFWAEQNGNPANLTVTLEV